MKVSHTDQQGDDGLYFVASIVTTDFDWIFRPQPHRDLGIDAIIEIKENNESHGELIALQIKSGSSWFSEQTENSIIFRTDDAHVKYWKQYPLPVLVVLHDPGQSLAYWQIVNDDSILSTGKGWKLEIPINNIFSQEGKGDIKKYCDFVLPDNSFDILSLEDISHGSAKRYSANIILNRNLSKGEIVQVIRRSTDQLKDRNYYRNDIVRNAWDGKQASAIWLFVYPSLKDEKNSNYICRSQWIDPQLKIEYRPFKLDGQNIGNDLVISWSDCYSTVAEYNELHALNKEEYLVRVDTVLHKIITLTNDAIDLTSLYGSGSILSDYYLSQMERLQLDVHALYFEGTEIGTAPLECKDYDLKFQVLIADAYNIVLPFSERGRELWQRENRDYLVINYIKQYQTSLSELEYERKKLR